jgi:hypothetical protein
VEPIIEGFEAIDLLPHGVRHGTGPPAVHHLDIRGEEACHALLPEAAVERAHGVWMGVGFLGALLSRAISEQHEGTDQPASEHPLRQCALKPTVL